MTDMVIAGLEEVPAGVAAVLSMFVTAARKTLSTDLVSVVMFGSAAEGGLAPTSDVNLLLVLSTISPGKMGQLRDALLAAEAAVKLRIMFLLESEVAEAAEFFAQKFSDILRRHRILWGKDVLAALKVSRGAEIFRLKQILMNLVLRLRQAYVVRGHRPEQVTRIFQNCLEFFPVVRNDSARQLRQWSWNQAKHYSGSSAHPCNHHRKYGPLAIAPAAPGNAVQDFERGPVERAECFFLKPVGDHAPQQAGREALRG